MLNQYKKEHQKAILQYIIVDSNTGIVLDSDDAIFSNLKNKSITTIHPFFESFSSLLNVPDQDYLFSCIHLNYADKSIITDISLKSFSNKKPALIIIQDLTSHYNNYQLTAQKRNESVIGSQILELKNEYLKEKEDFKNKFIANFSHEIREPLSGINTFIGLLNKTNLTTEQKDYLDIINAASNHLNHMIEDILDISKIEVGKLNLIEKEFTLDQFIKDLISKLKIKAAEKSLKLDYKINSNTPVDLIGDQYRLHQVLYNLLDNAIKFTNQGSISLEIALNQIRANKANINFKITDTGIGIKPENQKIIFNSFTQLNTEMQNKGSGLGLTITKSLVELMQGNIKIDSTPNVGTTISCNLNFKINTKEKTKKQPIEKVVSTDSTAKKKQILLVENSEITQLAILKILAGQKRFYVDIVSNPEEVIPILKKQKFDLILMDINLTNANGDELAKKIRSISETEYKKTPIIALTGNVFPEDLKRYKKAKMNAVISKPFNEESLLKTINKFLA